MKLLSAHSYRNGLGEIVEVYEKYPGSEYPFVGDNCCRYMADGKYIDDHPLHHILRDLDLIEEV